MPTAVSSHRRVVAPWRPGLPARLLELWEHRALVVFFGRRFVEKRYSRTWLGILWLPLRPGLDIAVRVLLFGGLLGISVGHRPYFVFFVVGMSIWVAFERTAYWATRSLEVNRSLLRKIYVPRVTVLAAAVVPAGVELLIHLALTAIVTGAYWAAQGTFYLDLSWLGVLLALGALVLIVLLGLAIGLCTSAFAMRARDVRFTFSYVMSFWFFLTPVIYPVSQLPARYRGLAQFNPAAAPVEAFKAGLLGTALPPVSSVIVSLATLVVVGALGLRVFDRAERAAVEYL